MSVKEFVAAATAHSKKRRARKKREAIHEDDFVEWCKRRGIWCVKLVFLHGRGWPDRTLFCPGGVIIFVEMKKDTTSPLSSKQREVRLKLKALGFTYLVGYGFKDAKTKVKQVLK